MQGTPITLTPDENGNVTFPLDQEGTKLDVTFTPSDTAKPIQVGPIETIACSEPGIQIFIGVH